MSATLLPRKDATIRLKSGDEVVYLGYNPRADQARLKVGETIFETDGPNLRDHEVIREPPWCACVLLLDTCSICKELRDEYLP